MTTRKNKTTGKVHRPRETKRPANRTRQELLNTLRELEAAK